MSTLHLKDSPTLQDLQAYVVQMVEDRGFVKEDLHQIFMLLTEEIGELAKAIRKDTGISMDESAGEQNAAHELADILIYVLDIADNMHIDLEKALREKEEINKNRVWK